MPAHGDDAGAVGQPLHSHMFPDGGTTRSNSTGPPPQSCRAGRSCSSSASGFLRTAFSRARSARLGRVVVRSAQVRIQPRPSAAATIRPGSAVRQGSALIGRPPQAVTRNLHRVARPSLTVSDVEPCHPAQNPGTGEESFQGRSVLSGLSRANSDKHRTCVHDGRPEGQQKPARSGREERS